MILKDLLNNYSYEVLEQRLLALYPEEKPLIEEGKYKELYDYLFSASPISHNVSIEIKTNIDDTQNPRERHWAVGQLLDNNAIQKQVNRASADLDMEFAYLEDWLGCQCSLNECSDKDFLCHVLYEVSYLGFDYGTIEPNLDFVKEEFVLYAESEKADNITLHDIEKELDFADGK